MRTLIWILAAVPLAAQQPAKTLELSLKQAVEIATSPDGAAPMLIELEKFNFWYGEKQALFDIDLKVEKAETVCVLGRNGVGKTTLCYDLASVLKRQGINVDMVKEVARLALREMKGWTAAQRERSLEELWKSGWIEEGGRGIASGGREVDEDRLPVVGGRPGGIRDGSAPVLPVSGGLGAAALRFAAEHLQHRARRSHGGERVLAVLEEAVSSQ